MYWGKNNDFQRERAKKNNFIFLMMSQVVCHSWLRFEREHGTLEDFDLAVKKVLFIFFFFVSLISTIFLI